MASYGATLDGVRGLLPHRELSATSQPSQDQAQGLLDRVSGWVEARIGGALAEEQDDVVRARAEGLARIAVELGGAALVQDASHPAGSGRGDSQYGSQLWERYRQALADLLLLLGIDLPGEGGGPVAVPLASFPAPLWSQEVGW